MIASGEYNPSFMTDSNSPGSPTGGGAGGAGGTPSELGPGLVVGGSYEITRLLGRGGMGSVWEAQHVRLPKMVAVKVLHGDVATDQDAFARFRREAEIASRLGHPNIVEVVDFNTLPSGAPYLVLEYLAGQSLAQRLNQGPVPLDETLTIARQIGSALAAAHRNDVVHRDLKPDNIFLVPTDSGGVLSDRVKVLDFGISKIRNSKTVVTQDAALVGTPQYMSPEQASGKNQFIDQRTDVFALGAIVYEMLSGQAPFAGNTLTEVIFKVVFEETKPLEQLMPNVSPAVAAAVKHALTKDLAARTADMSTFIAGLTGTPLQSLERRPTAQVGVGLASTKQRSSDAFDATVAPTAPVSPSGNRAPVAFDATVAPPSASSPKTAVTASSVSMRGEVVARTPSLPPPATTTAATTPPPSRSMGPWIAVAALIVAVPLGYLGYRAINKQPPIGPNVGPNVGPNGGVNTATTTPPIHTTVPGPNPIIVAQQKPSTAPMAVAIAQAPVKPEAPGHAVAAGAKPMAHADHAVKGTSPTKMENIPPEVASDLNDAEKALSSDPAEAIRLALRTQHVFDTERSHSLVTRGYCKKQDLGMSKASLRSVKSSAERARIKRECKAGGLDLD